jgi:hypothetical protein
LIQRVTLAQPSGEGVDRGGACFDAGLPGSDAAGGLGGGVMECTMGTVRDPRREV